MYEFQYDIYYDFLLNDCTTNMKFKRFKLQFKIYFSCKFVEFIYEFEYKGFDKLIYKLFQIGNRNHCTKFDPSDTSKVFRLRIFTCNQLYNGLSVALKLSSSIIPKNFNCLIQLFKANYGKSKRLLNKVWIETNFYRLHGCFGTNSSILLNRM